MYYFGRSPTPCGAIGLDLYAKKLIHRTTQGGRLAFGIVMYRVAFEPIPRLAKKPELPAGQAGGILKYRRLAQLHSYVF